jgi:hypothetical protein
MESAPKGVSTVKPKTRPATVDVDSLVRESVKPGVTVSFWGTIKVDPSKMRVSRSAGEHSLRALDELVQKRTKAKPTPA